MMYRKFQEDCGWEGETWYFFIPVEGNEEALKDLENKLGKFELLDADGDVSFTMWDEDLTEAEVDTLVKHSPMGYMDMYNKLYGKLTVPDWSDWEDAQNSIYKGGIKDLMS